MTLKKLLDFLDKNKEEQKNVHPMIKLAYEKGYKDCRDNIIKSFIEDSIDCESKSVDFQD